MNRFAVLNRPGLGLAPFYPARAMASPVQFRSKPALGCGGGFSPMVGEEDDSPEMGCDKCKRMRRQMRALEELSGRRLGQATCSMDPVPAGMACQETSKGDIICEDGKVHAKDCPNAPTVNVPGIAADDASGNPVAPAPLGTDAGLPDNTLVYAAGSVAALGILYALFG